MGRETPRVKRNQKLAFTVKWEQGNATRRYTTWQGGIEENRNGVVIPFAYNQYIMNVERIKEERAMVSNYMTLTINRADIATLGYVQDYSVIGQVDELKALGDAIEIGVAAPDFFEGENTILNKVLFVGTVDQISVEQNITIRCESAFVNLYKRSGRKFDEDSQSLIDPKDRFFEFIQAESPCTWYDNQLVQKIEFPLPINDPTLGRLPS